MEAGIRCVVTKSSYTMGEDFAGADLVVEDLGNEPGAGVTLRTLQDLICVPSEAKSSALDALHVHNVE